MAPTSVILSYHHYNHHPHHHHLHYHHNHHHHLHHHHRYHHHLHYHHHYHHHLHYHHNHHHFYHHHLFTTVGLECVFANPEVAPFKPSKFITNRPPYQNNPICPITHHAINKSTQILCRCCKWMIPLDHFVKEFRWI